MRDHATFSYAPRALEGHRRKCVCRRRSGQRWGTWLVCVSPCLGRGGATDEHRSAAGDGEVVVEDEEGDDGGRRAGKQFSWELIAARVANAVCQSGRYSERVRGAHSENQTPTPAQPRGSPRPWVSL